MNITIFLKTFFSNFYVKWPTDSKPMLNDIITKHKQDKPLSVSGILYWILIHHIIYYVVLLAILSEKL